jgi:hypothetical protein
MTEQRKLAAILAADVVRFSMEQAKLREFVGATAARLSFFRARSDSILLF